MKKEEALNNKNYIDIVSDILNNEELKKIKNYK